MLSLARGDIINLSLSASYVLYHGVSVTEVRYTNELPLSELNSTKKTGSSLLSTRWMNFVMSAPFSNESFYVWPRGISLPMTYRPKSKQGPIFVFAFELSCSTSICTNLSHTDLHFHKQALSFYVTDSSSKYRISEIVSGHRLQKSSQLLSLSLLSQKKIDRSIKSLTVDSTFFGTVKRFQSILLHILSLSV